MSAIVGYGSLLPDRGGICTGAEMRPPRPGEVGILNHPRPGDPWQQTLCDPATCKLGGCAPGGPYHQIPHAELIAAAQVEQAQADAEGAALDYERKVAFVAALRRSGFAATHPSVVAAVARVVDADTNVQQKILNISKITDAAVPAKM